jgi:hypothetical protein
MQDKSQYVERWYILWKCGGVQTVESDQTLPTRWYLERQFSEYILSFRPETLFSALIVSLSEDV